MAYDGDGNAMYLTAEEYEQFLGGLVKGLGKAAKWAGDRAGGIAQTVGGVLTLNPLAVASGIGNIAGGGGGGGKTKTSTPVVSVSGVATAPSAAVEEARQLEQEKLNLQKQLLAQNQANAARLAAERKASEKSKNDLLLYGGLGIGGIALVAALIFALK